MKSTNVKVFELNYDHYSSGKYDRDIVNSIPFHRKMHQLIVRFIRKNLHSKPCAVLDLGVGTGITSKLIQDELPQAEFDLVDFSKKMLSGARKRMGTARVQYIFGDYSKLSFKKKYDLVVSVIGIHHQNTRGKKLLFRKIYSLLKEGGVFLFGDLVTHKDDKIASLNQALHFHHLVSKATDQKTLTEWAHHHMFLNDLAPIEDQVKWLKEAGFEVEIAMQQMNTALLICRK